MDLRKLIRQEVKSLAVYLVSAENQSYETKRKAHDARPSRQKTRGNSRTRVVKVLTGGEGRKTPQNEAVHFLREAERARQSFKIFSSSSGSSPRPSRSIAAITSASLVNPRIIRIASIRSRCSFRASALAGRFPRRDSSAITSRISSSFIPFAMREARNDSGFLMTMQLSSLANTTLRLTGMNARPYTVSSRWARISAPRASSHSACSSGRSQARPPEFPKTANLLRRYRPVSRPQK